MSYGILKTQTNGSRHLWKIASQTIHDASTPTQWNYVDTESIPADDASRGVPAHSLERWVNGPEFLAKPQDTWLKRPEELTVSAAGNDPEVKKSSMVYATNMLTSPNEQFVKDSIERFSSWSRLKRVFAWILRYKRNLFSLFQSRKQDSLASKSSTSGSSTEIQSLSLSELVNAEHEILRVVQTTKTKARN